MRIGLYTNFLTPGQIGGIETYVRQLVGHLAQVDRQNQYTLFVTEQNRYLFTGLPDNFELIQLSLLPPGPFIVARLLHKLGLLPAYATRQIQRYPLDVLHYPGSTIDQPSLNLPCVLTLHDLQHEYHPEFFEPKTLGWRRRQFTASALKAQHIITISEFTRQSIIQMNGVSPDKVSVIYHGISPIFMAGKKDRVALDCFRQKYRLPDRFIFYPANPWPHKNHGRLLEALALLKQQHNLRCQLVLSGVWSEQEKLAQQIQQAGVADQVHVLGHLSYEELPLLYASATALVFPSLFEGFGLPVVEAMACGCPVVCAKTTSLPEIAGDAAIFIDPLEVAQIAEAIYNVWQSKSLRQSLREKGLQQARLFSWDKAARQTVQIYHHAC